MGLLYNNKKKSDLVVLSEEKLENPEGKAFGFELLPDSNALMEDSSDNAKGDGAKAPSEDTSDKGK